MALADSSCCKLENSELRWSCFFNKVGFVIAYLLENSYALFVGLLIRLTFGHGYVGYGKCWGWFGKTGSWSGFDWSGCKAGVWYPWNYPEGNGSLKVISFIVFYHRNDEPFDWVNVALNLTWHLLPEDLQFINWCCLYIKLCN